MTSKFLSNSEDTRSICSASQALASLLRAHTKNWLLARRFSEVLVSWIKQACFIFCFTLITTIHWKLIIHTVSKIRRVCNNLWFQAYKPACLAEGFLRVRDAIERVICEPFVLRSCHQGEDLCCSPPSLLSVLMPVLPVCRVSLISAWHLWDFERKFSPNRCVELGDRHVF